MSFNMRVDISDLMDVSGVKFGTSGIRGLVSEMTDTLCYQYTLAFAKVLNLQSGSKVAIAIDLRPSSPRIANACYAALKSIGIDVHYFGSIPTPAVAFYAHQEKMPAIMITGSHIPFDRNGIKFYSFEGEITKAHEAAITTAVFDCVDPVFTDYLPTVNVSAKEAYLNRYLNFFPKQYLAGKTVAFYEHSSVGRDIITELLTLMGAKVISLGRSDEFVPIDTEAVSHSDIKKAREWAEEHDFDIIISTDGDADRPLIGDEQGNWLRGDIVGLLTSQYLGIDALATPVSCNTAIESSGAFEKVVRTRIGSPYVIEAINSLQTETYKTISGFEANGGYILATDIAIGSGRIEALCTRDAVLPILAIIALSQLKQSPVSNLAQDLPQRVTASDRVKEFPIAKSNEIIRHLVNHPSEINTLLTDAIAEYDFFDTTDGLRITLTNTDIVHFRPSGNAPELRCYAESSNTEQADFLVKSALTSIKRYSL